MDNPHLDFTAHPASASFNHFDQDNDAPPPFESIQYDIICRRQIKPKPNSLKSTFAPSRFIHLPDAFEFAGWGSLTRLSLTDDDSKAGGLTMSAMKKNKVLGQWTASALAGNAVLGSVFYALPAVVAVGGIFSPISLSIATLILFLWRPIMEELASALPISGAPYTYLLNVSSKPLALVSAALLLLDFASTSVVSAATASTYLAGEVDLPFPSWVGAVIVLFIFVCISLTGIRESARIALCVLSFHVATMIVLMIIAAVHWGRVGNDQLRENWSAGLIRGGTSPAQIMKQVYYGFCLGMLGLTGFECTPSYVARIKDKQFPSVLRNLHLPAIVLNSVIMLLVLATVPLDVILAGANVLSVLSLLAAGRWLRVLLAIDAIVVLCGGVLTGILSACELFGQLAQNRAIPALFLRALPVTGAPFMSIISFAAFCGLLYATAGGRLDVVSQMFSLVWLTVMTLFPLSLLLLKFNRGRLRRDRRTPLFTILFAFIIVSIAIAGNIAVNPRTFGYFSAYFIGITFLFSLTQNKSHILRCLYWIYDQYPVLHRWKITSNWGSRLVDAIRRLKRRPICILVKGDEIDQLFRMILYVWKNEETSCLKVVHFSDTEKGVPSELEANVKILDEAFPELTLDLILVPTTFEPKSVAALAHNLDIPTSLMFMCCPGPNYTYSIAEFGARIISL
ncbi:AAAP amino acid permease [Macrolepiota fuliginosa MF-IS2]|uniref:AAAP amino acid permease n=1 Tax=Macrolepiota fuliginosa MF-IS2 TaxID=1400762 RepID=A0A9P5XPA5_9AGAR|nr:AAAP amino acid permease [Macrolepiota fuliginosa MF-IS2]